MRPAARSSSRAAHSASSSQSPLWAIGLIALARLAWYFIGSHRDAERSRSCPAAHRHRLPPWASARRKSPSAASASARPVSASVGTFQTDAAPALLRRSHRRRQPLPRYQGRGRQTGRGECVSAQAAAWRHGNRLPRIDLGRGAPPSRRTLPDEVLAVPGLSRVAEPADRRTHDGSTRSPGSDAAGRASCPPPLG